MIGGPGDAPTETLPVQRTINRSTPIQPSQIVATNTPLSQETYLPPPNADTQPSPTGTPNNLLPPPVIPGQNDKPAEIKKPKFDFSKLLSSGTLGQMSANIHNGIAVGTEWDGWKLTPNEQQQYDNVLGMMIEPLLEKSEYIPLVIGVLSLASIEGSKIGGFLKVNKDRKKRDEERLAREAKENPPVVPPTPAPSQNRQQVPVTPTPIVVNQEYNQLAKELDLPPAPALRMVPPTL